VPWAPGQQGFNVLDFGATGNGTTDDAPAIQAALNSVGSTNPGSKLYFPPGTYLLNSELEIKSSVHLDLSKGAVLKRGSGSMAYVLKNFNSTYAPTAYAGRGGIKITGGTIDANATALTGAVNAIGLAHAKDVSIREVSIRNVTDNHAIELAGCQDVVIDSCAFEGYKVGTVGGSWTLYEPEGLAATEKRIIRGNFNNLLTVREGNAPPGSNHIGTVGAATATAVGVAVPLHFVPLLRSADSPYESP
jgi:hypothetical protein